MRQGEIKLLKEGEIVRLRGDLVDRLQDLFSFDKQEFKKHLASYLNRDLVIINIDNLSYELSFAVLGNMEKYEIISFGTHPPSSNLMRIDNKDIEVFELQDDRIKP